MTDDVLNVLVTLIGIIGAVGGAWWRIHAVIQENRKELEARILRLENQAASFVRREEISDFFARVEQGIQNVNNRIDALLTAWSQKLLTK